MHGHEPCFLLHGRIARILTSVSVVKTVEARFCMIYSIGYYSLKELIRIAPLKKKKKKKTTFLDRLTWRIYREDMIND